MLDKKHQAECDADKKGGSTTWAMRLPICEEKIRRLSLPGTVRNLRRPRRYISQQRIIYRAARARKRESLTSLACNHTGIRHIPHSIYGSRSSLTLASHWIEACTMGAERELGGDMLQ